jgi:uroporphyrinogen decarboxylase
MRYEKCCLNATRELINEIQKEVPVIYHICGDNSKMLNLVSSTNAAVLDLDYQVDLSNAKKILGKKNCIRGNTNTQILGSDTYSVSDVTNEVSKTIEVGKPDGMFMYAAGCEWPWAPREMASRNLGIAKALTETLGVY